VCFTGKRERASRVASELRRIGVAEHTVVWEFPSPYREFILEHIPHIDELESVPGAWGATIGQYRAIKTAYELGLPYALFTEDDCRFMRDLATVYSALDSVPDEWYDKGGVLMLDHFGTTCVSGQSGLWRKCTKAWSTACYIADRRAMEKLIDLYESPVSGKYPNPVMRNCDHWWNHWWFNDSIPLFCAFPQLAVQCDCGDSTNYNPQPGLGLHKMLYAGLGLDWSLYARY
jgi:GR25 family glycosyltransferase involved in LPS biosynthesis